MAQRKKPTAQFKAKVALEALKEKKTANQICSEHEVHSDLHRERRTRSAGLQIA